MSAEENAIATTAPQLPAYLSNRTERVGTEDLHNVIIPPRLKMVQPQAKPPYSELFNPGDVIVAPQNVKICDKDGCFHFVPIYFFREYITWNPYPPIQGLNAIRDRDTDPRGEIARKALNPKTRKELCPDDPQGEKKMTHCEHINFVAMLAGDSPIGNTPIVISFSRAEHSTGANFAALIKMREQDLFACQFTAHVKYHANNAGSWYGLDIHNPSDISPWVEEEERFRFYLELHNQYKEANIQMEYGEDDADSSPAPAANSEF